MNNSNRILVLISSFRPMIGGAEIALEEISRRLSHFHFDIVTPRFNQNDLAEEEIAPNMTVYRVGGKLFFPIFGFDKVVSLFNEHNYKIVHAYQASYAGIVAMRLKSRNPETKFILTMQEGKNLGEQHFLIRWMQKRVIASADHITAISSYLTEYARERNKEAKITLIPNGVDLDFFRKSPSQGLREKLGINSDQNIIITISRLVYKNGVDLLIKAVHDIVQDRTRKIKLVIVGDGPLEYRLRQQASQLGMENHIIFIGQVEYRKIPEFLSIADVFVRPSRSEGLGNAFLEAMSVGIPTVGTAVGGITDFIIDKETGFLWKPSEGALAQKILEVFDNNVLRNKVALNGQRLVFERYSWDNIAQSFNQIYMKELL